MTQLIRYPSSRTGGYRVPESVTTVGELAFDHSSLSGLRLEARQKLNGIKPTSIGQASRISGVSPADVSVLLVAQKRGML